MKTIEDDEREEQTYVEGENANFSRTWAEAKARDAYEADVLWAEILAEATVSLLEDRSGVTPVVRVTWKCKEDVVWADYLTAELTRELEAAVRRVLETREKVRNRVGQTLHDLECETTNDDASAKLQRPRKARR